MKSRAMRLVSYIRVSTARQGTSGLGLEAQTKAVADYARANGATIVATYREVESGTHNDRPQLALALAHAKRAKIRCVVAKLDRLARNARFLLGIVESGAEVVFCDFPTIPPGPVGKFMLTGLASAAELESGMASGRTKDSLKAAKARGVLLGSARPGAHRVTGGANPKASKRAGEVATENKIAAYEEIVLRVHDLRDSGRTLQAIADLLNSEELATRRGKPWNPMQVSRVLDMTRENPLE